jgi:cysteine desulfurase
VGRAAAGLGSYAVAGLDRASSAVAATATASAQAAAAGCGSEVVTATVHYLDHAATTPMRPAAVHAMLPLLTERFGNPSGAHAVARAARTALDDARERLAAVVGAEPGEIVFTSGGTEADNMAIRGAVGARGGRAVCTSAEHHAVLHPVEHLGGAVVPVDRQGLVDLEALADHLRAIDDVSVVSVHLVNNETGVVQDLAAVAEVLRSAAPRALLHTDAAQALCWLDVRRAAAPADLVTLASHKAGGPKGIGALVVRGGTRLEPLLLGGGQERERRGGTPDVAAAVAFAVAAEEADRERRELCSRARRWRDGLLDGITSAVPGSVATAARRDRSHVAPGWAHVCLPAVRSEALLFLLEQDHGILASAASSCASGAQERSHVLVAMGVDADLALGSLRLSFGWPTTDVDVDAALTAVPDAAARLREAAHGGVPV